MVIGSVVPKVGRGVPCDFLSPIDYRFEGLPWLCHIAEFGRVRERCVGSE